MPLGAGPIHIRELVRGGGAGAAPVLDATGAGDAFDAGCLLSLLRDRADVEAAMRSGVAAGAAAVSVLGACEHPIRREHFEAILRDGRCVATSTQ